MEIKGMPPFVEDTYGKKYPLDQKNMHCGGQGAMFQQGDLAVKLVFANGSASSMREIQTDSKEYQRYQRKLIHLMAMPKMQHLSMPIASLKSPFCGYVMQFMTGLKPLDGWIKVLPEKEGGYVETIKQNGGLRKRLRILRNLAAVLQEVHNHGLVYCDLTPSNVFVSEKDSEAETWLIDIDNLSYENEIRTNWQTPWHRAPEVYNGQGNSALADCYSFAIIVFELLTLSKPFDGRAFQFMEDDTGWDDEESDWDQPINEQESYAQKQVESGMVDYIDEPETKNVQCYGIPLQYVTTPEIQKLLYMTLGKTGRRIPQSRPTMNEWYRALDQACEKLIICANGHRHFGKTCVFCEKPLNDTPAGIIVNQMFYLLESNATSDEDQDVQKIRTITRAIGEYYAQVPSTSDSHRKTTIEIPWKCFASAHKGHDKDSNAILATIENKHIVSCNCSDPKMKISLSKDQNNQHVKLEYDERYFYELSLKGDE